MASEIRKEPTLYQLDHLLEMLVGSGPRCSMEIGGKWVHARPIGFQGTTWRRFKIAWEVFTGRADALVGPDGQ